MPPDPLDPALDAVAGRFEKFARQEGSISSPLYERLAAAVAGDRDVLRVASRAREGQPPPNLLFGAVHLLLQQGAGHPLASFYPSLTAAPAAGDPFPAFRSFCLENVDAITRIISTRIVQTNEVRRGACVLPAYGLVARRNAGRPLALVEIGASAGLNLIWDRYHYDYGRAGVCGPTTSAIHIRCEPRGSRLPPIPAAFPSVASRIGIDLNPLDVRDPEAVAWLRALIWPEHKERADLLDKAVRIARRGPPTIVAGDALAILPQVLDAVTPDAVLCIVHSHTLAHFTAEGRERLAALLAAHARRRPLVRISAEWLKGDHCSLEMETLNGSGSTNELLARYGPHGQWIEWVDEGSQAPPA